MIREIVATDEELCNGCGQCVPACAEGALRVVNGKVRIVAETLCDGLGACLGTCPRGASKIERRQADPFDEVAVRRHLSDHDDHRNGHNRPTPHRAATTPSLGGCPSARFAQFPKPPAPPVGAPNVARSELTHWPVQLRLLSPEAPALKGARLLIAADCVPVAYAGFHSELLRDHAVVIACPKLDDPSGYVEKLAEIFRHANPAEITVTHMQVPCCSGLLHMVMQARQVAQCDLMINEIVIGIQGEILARRQSAYEPAAGGSQNPICCPSTGV